MLRDTLSDIATIFVFNPNAYLAFIILLIIRELNVLASMTNITTTSFDYRLFKTVNLTNVWPNELLSDK